MKWVKIILIWFCIIPFAILNGGFREYILEKYFTGIIALSLSGIILSVLIFIIALLLLPRIKGLTLQDSIKTGVIWLFLTIGFEFYFGLSAGNTLKELLLAYNPLNGNLWIVVLSSTLFSPILVYKRFYKMNNK